MLTKETLNTFLLNLEIQLPNSHKSRRKLIHMIPKLEETVELLFHVLDFAATVPGQERLKEDFFSHAETVCDFQILAYPIAIEGLAQKFESFLRVIGFIRYSGTEYWSGNEKSMGISGSVLDGLITGILTNRPNTGAEEKPLRLNPGLVVNSGIPSEIFKFVRIALRNAVHNAPKYQKKDLISYGELVLTCYLFAAWNNYDFLSDRFFPESLLRKQLIEKNQKWREEYLHSQLFEAEVVDLIDSSPDLIESDWLLELEEEDAPLQRKGKILEIYAQVPQLVILGDPGLGKTTTLKYLTFHLANDQQKYPLYFSLRDYMPGSALFDQILRANELNAIQAERKRFLKEPMHKSVVITSRQAAYHNDFGLPIFDLQPLDDDNIKNYILRFDQANDGHLGESIDRHPRLKQLCRNPLLLKILLSVSRGQREVPINKGLILKKFVENVLALEERKKEGFKKDLYFHFLVGLAFRSRMAKKVSFNSAEALRYISASAKEIDPNANRQEILDTLIDIGLLHRSQNFISFSHELYQEYLTAEGIVSELCAEGSLEGLFLDSHWEQPIILYSGLLDQPEAFISGLAASSPLLAAKCLENAEVDSIALVEHISRLAFSFSLMDDSPARVAEGFHALLKLGKSKMISQSIDDSLSRLGNVAYRFLAPVSAGLISAIDVEFLVPIIRLFTQTNKKISKTIIRSLETRDLKELVPYSQDIYSIFLSIGLDSIPLVYVNKLYQIFDNNKLFEDLFGYIRKQTLKLSAAPNASDFSKTVASRILLEYGLLGDLRFIQTIISDLGGKKGMNQAFLVFLEAHNANIIPEIIPDCLQSRNFTIQATGVFFCLKYKLIKRFSSLLENSKIYQNTNHINYLIKVLKYPNFLQGINRLYKKEQTNVYLQNCKLNDWFRVLIHNLSKEGYYSLSIPDFDGKARIYLPEIPPGTQLKLRKRYEFRVSFINLQTQTIQFSLLENGNQNYEISPVLSTKGSTHGARVKMLSKDFVLLTLDNGNIAVIRFTTSRTPRAYQLDQELQVKVQSYDEHRKQYVVLPVLPQKQHKIKKTDKTKAEESHLSDLGIRLKASLEKKGKHDQHPKK